MRKRKPIYMNMPDIVRYDMIDKFMFGYVVGLRRGLPSIKVTRAVEMFMTEFSLTEEDYPLASALVMYYRMFTDYQKHRKENLTNAE